MGGEDNKRGKGWHVQCEKALVIGCQITFYEPL